MKGLQPLTVAVALAVIVMIAFAPARAAAFDCNATAQSPINSAVEITPDPGTAWQPRGGQVRITVQSQTLSLENIEITACFRWAGITGEQYLAPADVQLVEAKSVKAPSNAVYA